MPVGSRELQPRRASELLVAFRWIVLRRVVHRVRAYLRPLPLRAGSGLSKVGERLGIDWLTYNPFVFRFYHMHAVESAPAVADTFQDVFPWARRFLDVGAGSGAFAAELQRRGHTVLAFEHSRLGRLIAQRQGVPVKPFDLAKNQPDPCEVDQFDVSFCFEVAEHLPPSLGDRLVTFVAATSATVVFTAAPPGQGGTGHINEQPAEYWISRFEGCGMRHRSDLQQRVAIGFARARSRWLATNVLVFTDDRRPCEAAPISDPISRSRLRGKEPA